jgi:phosphatidylserine/phosphatidylglycerophosphate/cardiolipin synthase-like enzyme
MLNSVLFRGDSLLEQIASDTNRQRISMTRNRHDPAVKKVQQALLMWDPNCLPRFGADGDYGSETAEAVWRFKVEVLLAPEPVIRDVGPLTVQRLDAIAVAHEQNQSQAARVAELDGWLTPPLSGVFSSVSSSDVIVHTSGAEAFAALSTALGECVDERALIVIAGWDFMQNTPLAPGVTIESALRAAAGRGARVRALFNHFPVIQLPLYGEWRPLPGNNAGPVAFVNGLPNGAAIHDARVLHHSAASLGVPVVGANIQLGVHHQKAWVVWTGERLVAWCGGIDINGNRIGAGALHDVQVGLTGMAAAHVYEVLRLRWEDHPRRPPGVHLPVLAPQPATGTHRCRVVTTFGNPTQFAGLDATPYSFAPTGSKATRQLLSHMIAKARSFVYVEDQYFVDESIGRELAAAMPNLSALIIVICDSNSVNGELHQAFARRRAVLDHLLPHAPKVAVVTRNNQFLHAKVWIFDDIMVMVNSANVNRRGLEHDTEIGVAFGDIAGVATARDIRERLWARHLGAHAPAAGSNPVSSLPLWKAPPVGSAISRYDWTTAGPDPNPVPWPANHLMTLDQFWEIVDPRCP